MLSACVAKEPEGEDSGHCKAALVAGDLIITEVMANPAGRDNDRNPEWFEIYNAATWELDLAGVGLTVSKADGSGERRTTLRQGTMSAGEYVVVARSPESARPDYARYGVGSSLGALRNVDGRIAITCGSNELDEVRYEDAGDDGVALQFDGSRAPDHTANDAPDHWCAATTAFTEESFGTPGNINSPCPGDGNTSPSGDPAHEEKAGQAGQAGQAGGTGGDALSATCDDGGEQRELRPLVAADLLITEYMADPENAPDGQGEWFEVLVRSDVDLNGLGLGKELGSPNVVLDATDCLSVPKGSRIVFAKSDDALSNGGVDAQFTMGGLALGNTAGRIVLEYAGEIIDERSWDTRRTKGASWSLDPDFETAASRDGEFGCDGLGTFGSGDDRGTPGAPNAHCVGPDECLDGVPAPRAIVGAEPGDLVISEVMADPENVTSDASGEWFEVTVNRDVDLNGLQLGKTVGDPLNTLQGATCLRATPGMPLLFARSADTARNGGLPSVDHEFSFSLTNTKGSLVLEQDGALLDAIQWTASKKGVSRSLDPIVADAELNDYDDAWCSGVGAFATGPDQGTPGIENPTCP